MVLCLAYPVKLTKDDGGGYVVTFPDVPEAITQGEDVMDALNEATDCLEEALANRIATKQPIPEPRSLKKYKYSVALHATLAAKVALYILMCEKKLTNVALARQLDCDEKEVRRILDPYYHRSYQELKPFWSG